MKYIFGFLLNIIYTIAYLLHVGIQILWNFSLDVDYRAINAPFKPKQADEFGWYSRNIMTAWFGYYEFSEELATIQKLKQEEECY